MTIQMIESFDYLVDAAANMEANMLASKWVGGQWRSLGTVTAVNDYTPAGRVAMQLNTGVANWTMNTPVTKFIVAHDLKFLSAVADTGTLCHIQNHTGNDTSQLVSLDRFVDNRVQVRTGTDVHGISVDPVVTLAVGDFYEMQANIATATGSVELWVNADKVITATDVDTIGTTTATNANEFELNGNQGVIQVTNLRIWDGTGTDFNEALGKITQNDTVLVTATGARNEWTTTGTATSNAFEVDETTAPDGDTTYLKSDVIGDGEDYIVVDLPVNRAEIHGVQVTAVARRAAGGDNDLKLLCMSNGTTATGGDHNAGGQQNMANNYRWLNEIFETDPDTGTTWTVTGARDHQPGYELASAT